MPQFERESGQKGRAKYNMDAFRKISGLLHDLLPSLKDAVDRVLAAKSYDYWNSYVLKNLDGPDRRYWRQRGICSVADIDLQGVLKIVQTNFDLFRESCGGEYAKRDVFEMRDVRNDYAHDNGAVPQRIALAQLSIIRAFVKWMKIPDDKLALVDKARNEIESVEAPRPVKIIVSKPSPSPATIPLTEYAMTQRAADQLARLENDQGLEFRRKLARSIKGEDGLVLTKRYKSLYSLDLGRGYSAVLFNTPNDDYIVVDVVLDTPASNWFETHSVNFDSETGHMMISHICQVKGNWENVTEWSNDLPGDKASDGEVDLPDHGGGSVDYEPNSSKCISLSETLKNNPSRKSAICVLDDELCKKMYAGALENWQVYLHPEQLKAVTMDSEGPMMVKGPAGTGKTVVLVHRAKWLLENVFTGNERILITTFNKSLEYTINQMLNSICTPQQLRRMDIVYFDQWLQKVWKRIGGEKILYREEDISDTSKNLFRLRLEVARAKGLVNVDRTDDFIEREYDFIVQEYKLRDEASYLAAVRPKKFGLLRQDERRKLWQAFRLVNGDPFDPKMSPMATSTRMRVINHVTKAIEARKFGIAGEYAAVLVDESQDMGAAEYRLFGALTGNVVGHENPNSLLFAGDGHQRIYGRMGSLISCGINVRGGRTVLLKKCYRSSTALKKYAEKLLDGFLIRDMDDVKETLDGSEALDDGVDPVECFGFGNNYEALHDATADKIKEWMAVGSKRLSDYAVLLREGNFLKDKTWKLRKTAEAMSERGLKAVVVSGRDKHDESDSIKVMTMHRAKGMQFYGVVINLDGWPHKPDKDADGEARKENEEDERKLLYMAILRAVRFVMLTGRRSKPSQLEKPIPESKVQSTFDFGEGVKETGIVKSKKRPVPKQDELPLTNAKPVKAPVRSDSGEDADIYEKFIEYIKSLRKDCGDAIKYRQDVIERKSNDKAKMVMALYYSKQHAAALEPYWSDFTKKNAVTITLEEAATRSASKHNDVVNQY